MQSIYQRQPDITKARTILAREPKVDCAEGLQKHKITLKHCHHLSGQSCLKNFIDYNLFLHKS